MKNEMKKYKISKEESAVIDSKTLNIIQDLGFDKINLLEIKSMMYNRT